MTTDTHQIETENQETWTDEELMNYNPELAPELPPEDEQGEVEPEVEGTEEEAVE